LIFIEHRKNKASELASVDSSHGVEIDLRADKSKIYVAHDAFAEGESFENWLETFSRQKIKGPLLLNTKEDGLEAELMKMLKERGIDNYLFLDTAVPTFIKNATAGHGKKFFMRLSVYEPLSAVLPFEDQIEWLWVDCFGGRPLEKSTVQKAAEKFKLCLVSPELQAWDLEINMGVFLPSLKLFSAICTKHPNVWKQQLKGAF